MDVTTVTATVGSLSLFSRTTDDTAKGGLTIFWGLFTVIPCAPNHLKRYLKTSGSQIETGGSLRVEEGIL